MPEIASPLLGAAAPPRAPSPSGPAPLRLSETRPAGLTQLAGWEGFDAAAAALLGGVGFADAGDYRIARESGGLILFRIGPDKLWLLSEGPSLDAATPEDERLVALDLGHARTRLVVDGPAAEALLARLAPIDFRRDALPPGGFVQTGVHHVGVLIHRRSQERFDLLTPVTWARSLWESISVAATPFGYETAAAERRS